MNPSPPRVSPVRKHVRANGAMIHYVEAGEGPPLLLLHGGFSSTSDVWEGHPTSYASYLGAIAARFRVIAPDTRGHGQTLNPGGGSIGLFQLADDVVALSSALGLVRPLIGGFSDGGAIATVAAIRSPSVFRAVVNDAGFDILNPRSPTYAMSRQIFGGSPDATEPKPESFEAFCVARGGGFADLMRRMQLDHREQGEGGWKATLAMNFRRMTIPPDITLDDLRKVTAPMLILTGDRDMFCSAEEAVAAYRLLGTGELGIVPGAGHEVSEAVLGPMLAFLERHRE